MSSAFGQSLILMLEGMAGIFVFMAVFYGLISLLNRLFKPTKEDNK
ncbi:MAG TPA: OadG-related small transporter subunit [Candidatus Cloacimonadota bacterium]|nr:OadG-related small transporter subunit [Candidatus Cloacimonadota bacterium]